ALSRFRTQVGLGVFALDGADHRLEHEVELPRLGKRAGGFDIRTDDLLTLLGRQLGVFRDLAGLGTDELAAAGLADELLSLLLETLVEVVAIEQRHWRQRLDTPVLALDGSLRNQQMVGTVALLGLAAIDHRIA